MDLLGLLLFQEITEAKSEHVNWKTKYGEKQQTYSSATFKFTWVDVDTAETLVHQFHADGFNDWDKSIGSAMTYAERYYIMKQFHIPTSELDPDSRKPDEEPTEKKPTEAQKLFNDAVAKKLSPDWNAIKAKHNVKTSEELTSKQIEEIRKELGL
jgi:hypothetical protein